MMNEPALNGMALTDRDRSAPLLRSGNSNCGGCGMSNLMQMLRRVVEEGTGRAAKLEEYSVAGKTGTAQLVRADGRGYRAAGRGSSNDFSRVSVAGTVGDPRPVNWLPSAQENT